jgi:hypothetical protein
MQNGQRFASNFGRNFTDSPRIGDRVIARIQCESRSTKDSASPTGEDYVRAMTKIRLGSVSLDCADTTALATFWASLLGGEIAFSSEEFAAVRLERMWLTAVKVEDYHAPTWPEGDVGKQMHLDLAVESLEEAEAEAIRLGATRAQYQSSPDRFIVLLDPAGHPFCVTTQIPD